MTKELVIKQVYADNFDKLQPYIDKNGWLNKEIFEQTNVRYEDISNQVFTHNDFKCRPKSLQGIENNNGWIKIESESDLPKDNIDCFCVLESGKILITNSRKEYFWCSDNKWLYNYYEFTHYQPIEKPKPPLY